MNLKRRLVTFILFLPTTGWAVDRPNPTLTVPSAKNWGLKHSETTRAWSMRRLERPVVIAVIDTGMDVDHQELSGRLWTNPGETGLDKNGNDKATNGIDDDGNGYIDDLHGWNFVDNNSDLTDEHGHGTHIAGIIAGRNSGVAPNAQLMVLKYYSPRSSAASNLDQTVRAIRYAVKMRAEIINYSSGGPDRSADEEAAIRRAGARGILFVSAAGNEGADSDRVPFFPADYGLENVMSVAALTSSGQLLPASNRGSRSVDIAAPGSEIYSSLPNDKYGYMSGTSQATAFVSGVAALLLGEGRFRGEPQRLRDHISRTGVVDQRLVGKLKSSARLSTYRALAVED